MGSSTYTLQHITAYVAMETVPTERDILINSDIAMCKSIILGISDLYTHIKDINK